MSTKKTFLISLFLTLLFFFIDVSRKTGYFLGLEKRCLVARVIDGDTVEVSNKEKIRLIGINAPEIGDKFGKEAKEFLSSLIEGRVVKIEEYGKDEYGRKLAFLFLEDRNINVEIVKSGFAHIFKINKVPKHVEELRKAEEEAMDKQLGIWKKSNITCIKLLELKVVGEEKVILKNECKFPIQIENWSLEDESHNRFKFPKYLFRPNETIEIYTRNKTTRFSFKKKFPIWDREGDTLFLRDSQGFLVLFYRY
jgi:endonuclease YncB( thermonuclease family)